MKNPYVVAMLAATLAGGTLESAAAESANPDLAFFVVYPKRRKGRSRPIPDLGDFAA